MLTTAQLALRDPATSPEVTVRAADLAALLEAMAYLWHDDGGTPSAAMLARIEAAMDAADAVLLNSGAYA